MMTRLDKLTIKLESGSRPKGGVKNETTGIPSLGAEHLNSEGSFNFTKIKYIAEEFFENQKAGIIRKEDILVVKDGATTGKVSFVGDDFPYERASINEHIFKLTLNKSLVIPKYAYWHLFSLNGRRQILQDFRGATVGGISKGFTKNIKFPLPSLEEQERIVKILDQVDALRQKRRRAIGLLDDYLKSVFLEMFGDPVRNPRGWEKKKLGEITESRLGKMRDKQYITGKYLEPYLGNSNVKWFYFDLSSLLEMDFDEQEKIRYSLHDGDLLICEGGDIGRCAIWRNQLENCYFQKALHRIRTDKRIIIPEYLQWVLFFYSKGNAFKESRSQATIAHLTGIKLKRLPVPVAKIDLQNEFAKTIQKTEAIKQKMLAQSKELENQFQTLMQRAFKGEL